jgi:hypothetical protein
VNFRKDLGDIIRPFCIQLHPHIGNGLTAFAEHVQHIYCSTPAEPKEHHFHGPKT